MEYLLSINTNSLALRLTRFHSICIIDGGGGGMTVMIRLLWRWRRKRLIKSIPPPQESPPPPSLKSKIPTSPYGSLSFTTAANDTPSPPPQLSFQERAVRRSKAVVEECHYYY
eukprot:scaffold8762_cov138-Skeletonema_dohrnii-CCMP3373.AAC.3